ncbi:MAG: hypothetical protein Q7T55_09030 [Solirubrobacteraceae bacterium]|nr:hypothetical protein [Solirubrobacteraceae bacterium]
MSGMRSFVSSLLAALACALAVVAIAATWMDRQVMQSEHWTETSVQVLRDPQVQALTASFLADQVVSQQDAIRDALPERLKPFAGTATAALRDTAEKVALDALRTGALEGLWREASRSTHEQFVRWLDGRDVSRRGDLVTLDLQPALDRLALRAGIPQGLVDRAAESSGGRVALIRAGQFEQTQRDAHRLEQAASLTLPAAIVVALLSILIAPRRRWGIVRVGLAAAVAGAVVVLAGPQLRAHLADGLVDGGAARPVAASILDLTMPSLVLAGWLTAVGGAVVAVLAFATRPGRSSSRPRSRPAERNDPKRTFQYRERARP